MKGILVAFVLNLIFTLSSGKSERKRALIFPPISLYGTFVAIAVPIDLPDKNVFVSYNFESNYSPVTNITEIDEVLFPNLPVVSSRQSRSITRELAYIALETRFKEHGMNGRECLLRNICEAAETPLHHNGLLGHVMHIIFTPSSSKEEGLDDEYYEAEAEGLRGNCDRYLDDCPWSLFDVITRLVVSSRQSRSITRELAYIALETRFKEHGMNGRECLLRNICEAAETPLHHNGLLGHVMHIIFTPSSSKEEGLDDEYYEAEAEGLRGNCDRYLDDCPWSLFDVITRLVEFKS